jgi:succinate dehydrogenase flavin-adding protein (antitoxin of CptAB toxin-antitoxin module)
MRELDVLLTSYLERQYPHDGEPAKKAFRRLLELPDPDLISYLLSRENPADQELSNVIERIRGSAAS